jgi:AcrR family transcriptional regulator
MLDQESTREKIKAAALEEFGERGYDGARMQEIANRAGANKAMIHYYFQSKDVLFEAIIKEAFEELFRLFSEIWDFEDVNPEDSIPKIVHTHLKFLSENPHLPRIMVRELNSGNPIADRVLRELFEKMKDTNFGTAVRMIATGIKQGKIRKVDPQQTVWNFVALNLFIFIAKPILQTIWQEDFKDEKKLLEKREKAIVDLLLYGLLPR